MTKREHRGSNRTLEADKVLVLGQCRHDRAAENPGRNSSQGKHRDGNSPGIPTGRMRRPCSMPGSLSVHGRFGSKVMFLFDHVGIIDAPHEGAGYGAETAAIEARAQDLEVVPGGEEKIAARLFTNRENLYTVWKALKAACWEPGASRPGRSHVDVARLELPQIGAIRLAAR